jgi:transcriptional regulator GlxA family with amidase domain
MLTSWVLADENDVDQASLPIGKPPVNMRFGILIYDGVEPVDLATYGVLSMARRVAPEISIFTVAPDKGPVEFANGLMVIADHGFDNCPDADALIVTGGPGWVAQSSNPATLAFLRRYKPRRVMAGVCTGGMIMAAAGLLEGRAATTKREVIGPEVSPIKLLRERHPQVKVEEGAGLVDSGTIVTGGGVTLGIDATLHLLVKLLGQRVADETARIMEYSRAWRANREAMPVIVQ